MTLPKFIITMDGYFRLGMVNQHKHLLKPGDQCIGGGYYHFDFVSNRILLDRVSYDFGRPKWHLLETLKVPSTYRGMQIVYSYDDGFHDDFNVSEELNIDYDSIWRTQDEIRTVVNAVLGECIWNLSYSERRMAIELELTVTLDDDAIGDLCCQFPIPADYDGIGAKGSKFAFYL